jgi:hypothetical protein
MSDFLAIAAVRGKVLHLVEWDRPVWFLADDPEGDRIIPELNSIFTDALMFFHFKILIYLPTCLKAKGVRIKFSTLRMQHTLTKWKNHAL